MTLGEFQDYISSYPDGTIFPFGVSAPFSWRGDSMEVGFAMVDEPMAKQLVLEFIEQALTNWFDGWDGCDYMYFDHTPIHFEARAGQWTSDYVAKWIARIEQAPVYVSQEERLVKLAFRPTEGS